MKKKVKQSMIGNWPKPTLIFASSVALPTSFMDGLLSDTFQKISLRTMLFQYFS